MRPAEYTPEQIIEASLDLKAAGRNVTGFAIRQRLGGGNPTRLKQIWDEHANSQAMTRTEPVADLPAEVAEELATVAKALTDRLTLLAVELNDKAVKTAERRVSDAIHTAGQQRELAERELADATTTVEDLEAKLDGAEAQITILGHDLALETKNGQERAVEAAQLKERLVAAEQALKSAQAQHAAEIRRLNDQATTAAENHQEQRKTAASELNRAADKMAKLEEKISAANKEVRAARDETATLRGKLQAFETILGKQDQKPTKD